MRTQDEIVERIEMAMEYDVFGFEWHRLADYLDAEHVQPYLEEDAKWQGPTNKTPEQQIRDYMEFAWEKANNCRGISANRSVDHMRAWLWLAGEDELLEQVDNTPYEFYGKPQLKLICEHYGFDWESLDSGHWVNSEAEL